MPIATMMLRTTSGLIVSPQKWIRPNKLTLVETTQMVTISVTVASAVTTKKIVITVKPDNRKQRVVSSLKLNHCSKSKNCQDVE